MGGLTFFVLRSFGCAQILVKDKDEVEKLREHQVGTILKVAGVPAKDQRAPGGVEVHDAKLTVEVPVLNQPPVEIDKPLSHDSENLETLLDYRPVSLRNLREQAIFKVQAQITESLRQYFKNNEFTEIRSPKLLAAATEGGAGLLKWIISVSKRLRQLRASILKQIMVGVFERVYEIAPVYRAEPSATTRHMTEFISVDGEMGFIDLEDLKRTLSEMLNYVVDDLWTTCAEELDLWQAVKPLLKPEIPTLTIDEIHQKYTEATGTKTVGEKDLRPDEERWICEYAKKEFGSGRFCGWLASRRRQVLP